MKYALCGMLAGLASGALAQSGWLTIVPESTTIDTIGGGSFTLSIYGDADFGTHIAGGAFALDGSGDTGAVTGMDWTSTGWAAPGENDRGYGGNGDYDGVVFGQVILPNFGLLPSPASSLANGGVLLGWFDIQIANNATGILSWDTIDDAIADFVLEVYDESDDSMTRLVGANMSHGSLSTTITLVPAPASLALLGLGFVAGRRRRS